MDTSVLGALFALAPDLMGEIELRSLVLERVAALEPIGRRALAQRLHLAEREVRAAADALRRAGCVVQSPAGMELTEAGRALVETARRVSRGRRSLASLELTLSGRLNAARVCVAPGDARRDSGVLEDVAHAAAGQLRFLLQGARVLAVSGGEALARTARAVEQAAPADVTVVPAQGGLGGSVRAQANAVAEAFAARLGGKHRPLHLPEGISPGAAQELGRLPQVREALELLGQADVLLYGVSGAREAAELRGMSGAEREALAGRGAVAEALGVFLDARGVPVWGEPLPALRARELEGGMRAALVAAGSDRAEAILAACMRRAHSLLVTDEGAALRILELLRE